jgi:MFS family permease
VPASRPDPSDSFGWRFTAPLYLGSALNPVNSSLLATALVPIARALHVSVGRTAVLVASLYLASAIAQPTMGKLSEELGPRRMFVTGILLVLVGGVVGGAADSLAALIIARVLIGIGTSAGYPSAMLLIRRRATTIGLQSPPSHVLGGLAISGAATIAIGPTIGGLLVGWFNWRAAFLINIPVAAIAFRDGSAVDRQGSGSTGRAVAEPSDHPRRSRRRGRLRHSDDSAARVPALTA